MHMNDIGLREVDFRGELTGETVDLGPGSIELACAALGRPRRWSLRRCRQFDELDGRMQQRTAVFSFEIDNDDFVAASREAVRQLAGDCGNRPHERGADRTARCYLENSHLSGDHGARSTP